MTHIFSEMLEADMKANLWELLNNGFTVNFSLDKTTGNIRMKARASFGGSPYGQDLEIIDEYLTPDRFGYIFQETLISFLKATEDKDGQV